MDYTLVFVVTFFWLLVLSINQNSISIRLKNLEAKLKLFNVNIIESNQDNDEKVLEDSINNISVENEIKLSDEDASENDSSALLQDTLVQNLNETNIQLVESSSNDKKDIEKMFIGNIFNKIGAIALLVGFAIFIKLISPYIIFTPELKLALGYLSGFGILFGAFKIRAKENLENFSEVLMGTALGTLFITTYCGCTNLKVFSMTAGIIIASLFLIMSFYIAERFKKISTISIALIAGYLNPFITNISVDTTPNFIFGYLIFVNMLSLIYVYKNQKNKCINYINLILTLCCTIALDYHIALPIFLFGLYVAYDLILKEDDRALICINYFVLTCLSFKALDDNHNHLAFVQLGVAILLAIVAFLKFKQKRISNITNHLILISLNFAICLFTKEYDNIRTGILSLETILLSYLSTKFNYRTLSNWAICTWVLALVKIIPLENVFYIKLLDGYFPIWNSRLLALSPLIISSLISYKIFEKTVNSELNKFSEVFRFKFISLLYVFGALELNSCVSKYLQLKADAISYIKIMLNIIIGFIYTLQFRKLEIQTENVMFKLISMCVGYLSLITLLLTGFRYLPIENFIPIANIRFIAFVIAIVTCLLHFRWTKTNVYNYIAIFLGFYLIHFEIANTIEAFKLTNFEYLLSVSWVLYAGVITFIGIFRNLKVLKISGIILCLLSIIRIFVFDLSSVDIIYKFIAFLVLGVILMFLSYVYNKNLRK